MGSKLRVVDHIQKFQMAYRQRERRAIRRYNKSAKGKRNPVDASRSYLKFFVAFEQGKKGTKRSHWHVICMAESHFPIPLEELAHGEPARTMPQAKRVWDHPIITGPITPKRPAGARDPEVFDFRVNADANQDVSLWPHGQCNVKRLTHNMNDLYGPVLKSMHDLSKTIDYVSKYFHKGLPKRGDMAKLGDPQTHEIERRKLSDFGEKDTQRTCSRGIGHRYAKAFGQTAAIHGMPLADVNFRISGFEFWRSPKSEYEFQQSIMRSGASEMTAFTLTDRRIVFQMRGAMRRQAFDAYHHVMRKKRPDRPIDEKRYGDAYHLGLMEKETAELRDFLNSHEAKTIRWNQPKTAVPLPEAVPLVDVYKTDDQGNLMEPKSKKYKAADCFRSPWDRLQERRSQIKAVRAAYDTASQNTELAFGRVKAFVSGLYPEDILTDCLYEARPIYERDRFKREIDADALHVLLQETALAAENGDSYAKDCLQWLKEFQTVKERDAFELPRGTVHHDLVPATRLLAWVNHSEDYEFPWLRERFIDMFCTVETIDPECRIISARSGRQILQRLITSDEKRSVLCPDTKTIIRHSGFKRWAGRLIENQFERDLAYAGRLALKSPKSRASIFVGPAPFRIIYSD